MNSLGRLDKISYYLSYTDIVPILNIPSAIVHFICAIRDRALGVSSRQKYPPIVNESFRQIVIRKLDKQSHLQKGVLAISGIGCLILVYKCIKKKWDVHQVCKRETKGFEYELLNDREIFTAFLKKAKAEEAYTPKHPNLSGPSNLLLLNIMRVMDNSILKNKNFIISLINEELIDVTCFPVISFIFLSKADREDIVIALLGKERNKSNLDDFYKHLGSYKLVTTEVREAYQNASTRHRLQWGTFSEIRAQKGF